MANHLLKHKPQSIERQKTLGEVFTPTPLVEEILHKLPPELFSDPTKTFLDPAAGNGQFLEAVIRFKIDAGCSPTKALHTTYGVELMQDNVQECKERLINLVDDTPLHRKIVNHNIICANSLEYDYDSLQPYPLPKGTKMTTKKKPSTSEQLKIANNHIETISNELLRLDDEIIELTKQNQKLQKVINDNTEVSNEVDTLVTGLQELVTKYQK